MDRDEITMLQNQVRAFDFRDHMRVESGDDGMVVEGYAIRYDEPTMLWPEDRWGPGFWEVIRKGASTAALKTGERFYLWQHDRSLPLAREKTNTLVATEDDQGVLIRATFIDSQFGRDCFASVDSGLVDKQSFRFSLAESEGYRIIEPWDAPDGSKAILREIFAFETLREFSAVTWPAYQGTDLEARSIDAIRTELAERAREADTAAAESNRLAHDQRERAINISTYGRVR